MRHQSLNHAIEDSQILSALPGVSGDVGWRGADLARAALLVGGLALGLTWRSRERGRAQTAVQRVALQSRIQPHFLFNTLNTAIALVREQPVQAEALLEDLAELFQHALRAQHAACVPLVQEIALARLYLNLAQARFAERLRVTWSLDPAADMAQLPPLLLQPLVENAVQHGVEPSLDGADVHIQTQRLGDVVLIHVVNTVPADASSSGHGLALRNVRDRLALMRPVPGRMHTQRVGDVFHVALQLQAPWPSTKGRT